MTTTRVEPNLSRAIAGVSIFDSLPTHAGRYLPFARAADLVEPGGTEPFLLAARVDNCAEGGCMRLSRMSSIVRFYAANGGTRHSASYRRFSRLAGVLSAGPFFLFFPLAPLEHINDA